MILVSYIVYNKREKLFKAVYKCLGDGFGTFLLSSDVMHLIKEFALEPADVGNLTIYKGPNVGLFRAISEVKEAEEIEAFSCGGG